VSVATQPRAQTAILEATERLLRERPLSQLSVADIIEAAGVSRTTFYAYFASKTAVIAEALREVMDQVIVAVRPFHAQSGGDTEAAIRLSLRQWVEVCKTHGALLRSGPTTPTSARCGSRRSRRSPRGRRGSSARRAPAARRRRAPICQPWRHA
jgi:AcrR family transcriptional regulator